MKIKVTAKKKTTKEADIWLKSVSDILSDKFSNISEEESLRRMMTWGTVAIKVPDVGKAEYVDMKDMML